MKSSPADLAVAFRSLDRRLANASNEEVPLELIASARSSVDGAIAAAAALLGVRPEARSVAEAIEAMPAKDWTDVTLGALQARADDAGRAIRAVENASPQ